VHFVGRLATYKYYNMDQVVAQALTVFKKISGEKPKNNPSLTEPVDRRTRQLVDHYMHAHKLNGFHQVIAAQPTNGSHRAS